MFKSWLQELAVVVIFFASIGLCQYLSPRRKAITLDHEQTICSQDTACRFAICLWERTLVFSNENCTVLDSSCYCPQGEICTWTNDYSPRNFLITYEYKCKNPAELFVHQGAFYVNPQSRLNP